MSAALRKVAHTASVKVKARARYDVAMLAYRSALVEAKEVGHSLDEIGDAAGVAKQNVWAAIRWMQGRKYSGRQE